MIRLNLILFLRNILRQKLFATINFLGLTAGIFSSLLIYLYVKHEFSFDRFHENAGRIYRINQTFIWGEDNDQQFSSTGPGVLHAIAAEIPEASEVTRILPPGNALVTYMSGSEARSFDESQILAVDSNFFRVFTFPPLRGDANTALVRPNNMVMTMSCAKKYFGSDDPVGRIVQVSNPMYGKDPVAFVVTGVVDDPPANSYIDFDMLVSMTSIPRVKQSSWSWVWTMFETYVLLEKNASVESLRTKLGTLPSRYAENTLKWAMGTTYAQYTKSGKQWNLYAQPITDIHLHSQNVYNRFPNAGSIQTVYVLSGVVVFIIILSCINFMNLSTAQYTKRARETSLRKIFGSGRWQLGRSFFMEAFFFCTVSLCIAIALLQVALPFLNEFSGTGYTLAPIADWNALWLIAALLVVMSFISGSYPAVFHTAFKPVEAMKGDFSKGKRGRGIRNALVVFQFAISLVLVVSTMVVFRQLKFLAEKDTGFERENLLVIRRLEWISDKQTFLDAIARIQGVETASWCSSVPPRLYDGDSFRPEAVSEKTINLNYVKADEAYRETLKFSIATGRYFDRQRPSDISGVILNETAVRELGWKVDETVIGKRIQYPGDNLWFEVIGVVRDFNYWSLQGQIEPMAIFNIHSPLFFSNNEFAAVRIVAHGSAGWQDVINGINNEWKKFAGDAPFQYEFVDDAFAESFREQDLFGKTLAFLAALTILIASLGLLGMIVFTLEMRTREIGIRKVIGATVWNILTLVSRQYIRLLAISLLVSIPVSLWLMNRWLQAFQYRIEIGVTVFAAAGIAMFLLALLISSYHSVKAALTNPVDVLKNE